MVLDQLAGFAMERAVARISTAVFLVFCVLALTGRVCADDKDRLCTLAFQLLEADKPDSALYLFQKIHNLHPSHHKTLYGLALTYARLDSPADKCVDFLDPVANQKPGLIDNPLAAGRIYEKAKFYNKAYPFYKSACRKQKYFPASQMGFSRMLEALDQPNAHAVSLVAKAVLQAPQNDSLYQFFLSSALRNLQESKAIEALQKLVSLPGADPERVLDLADFYLIANKYDKIRALLQEHSGVPICRSRLLLAKTAFEEKQDDEGTRLYWQAVESAQDDKDISWFAEDLYYLLQAKEKLNWFKITPSTLGLFLQQFWQSRDPDRTTDKNERIPEHFHRLAKARREYRRYGNPDQFGYFTRHRTLDDLGTIFVRHGQPDMEAFNNPADYGITAASNYAQENEVLYKQSDRMRAKASLRGMPGMYRVYESKSWAYQAFYDQPEMTFHFVKKDKPGHWCFSRLPESYADRWVLGGVYTRIDFKMLTPTPAEMDDFNLLVAAAAQRDSAIGFITETSRIREKPLTFDCQLAVYNFKEALNRNTVEFYYLLPGKELPLSPADSSRLKLHLFAAFYDANWQEIVKTERDKIIPVPVSAEEWKKGTAVLVERFSLPVDSVHFEFQVADGKDKERTLAKGTMEVRDYGGDKLKMSDILCCGPIKISEKATTYRKGAVVYEPHMFYPYHSGDLIGLYFEVYNLRKKRDNTCQAQITCYLKSVDPNTGLYDLYSAVRFVNLLGKLTADATSSFIYSGESQDQPFYLNIDIGKRKKGNYQLTIIAQDLLGGETIKTVDLAIE